MGVIIATLKNTKYKKIDIVINYKYSINICVVNISIPSKTTNKILSLVS